MSVEERFMSEPAQEIAEHAAHADRVATGIAEAPTALESLQAIDWILPPVALLPRHQHSRAANAMAAKTEILPR